MAAIQTEQFRSIGLPDGHLMAVFHLDGTLVASYPERNEDVGKRFNRISIVARYLPRTSRSFWPMHAVQGSIPSPVGAR